ncbi:hypothetical protein FACS1894217_11010 [Clostridia bacterium]|nr:hypothetical protein FACS1894217_11010 [Clostridia bacterium]
MLYATIAPVNPGSPTPATSPTGGKTETDKSKLPLILGIIGGVLVVAIVVTVLVVKKKK